MLLSLRIINFALIDCLEINFEQGLNVLTGETGAGKSILLDAIDLLLGGKAGARVLRQGCPSGSIEGIFTAAPAIDQWLAAQGIEPLEDSTIACTREFSKKGSSLNSRSRLNGVLINRQVLAELRGQLVEITAQGQTQRLLDPGEQRQLLDLFGGQALLEKRQTVENAYKQFTQAKQALTARQQSEQNRLQRLDFLTYQLQELTEAELTDGDEWELLIQEQEKLSHVVELQQLSYQATQLLYQSERDTPAIADLLGDAEGQLQTMAEFDSALNPLLEMVQTALTQVIEAGRQVQRYGDNLEADPERLGEVEARLQVLKRICRKYGPSLTEAIAYQEKIQAEYDQLTDGEQSLAQLQEALAEAEQKLIKHCGQLTLIRQKTAQKLEKRLVQELKPLAMEKVIFVCQLESTPPSSFGAEQVVFYFSPNTGEKIQPLAATASGGEMSRFLLALKACFSDLAPPSQTLIFDEIDVGVSGKVAQAIADKLAQLSQRQQLLCVTHQPLVAALADAHFHVDKVVINENIADPVNPQLDEDLRTVIRITPLQSDGDRQQELAQLTGGHSAKEALAFAQSLLEKSAARRQASQV
ncbi:DNA repair protein RecN [Synechocystis salina LEGE 06099]|uniref:DNA repair protein RecN n=1 Tax=Synechocystis salina TaxID=945780 RepID=UPI00187FF195|nr:DNA repair protein RecN [Synechocystis salina]MBE9202779.1 DNA repair protein RecN [Synechocystis salina LEGE 06099]